jgi:hypothetical protein
MAMRDTCTCPSCGRALRVPESIRGQRVRCPSRNATFTAQPDVTEDVPASSDVQGIQPSSGLPRAPTRQESYEDQHWEERHRRLRYDDDDYGRRPEEWPQELPGRGRAITLMVLPALCGVVSLGSAAITTVQMNNPKPAAPPAAQAGNDELAELFANPAACVQPFVNIPTIVLFCLWIYRAYKNLSYFRVRGLKYSAGWAVGSFFVPILNLFRPCQIAQETWRASDPDVPLDDPRAWQSSSSSGIVGLWWAAWLISNIMANVALRMELRDPGQGGEAAAGINILSDLLSALAALLAILMIRQVQARQTEKYRLMLES